jgi:flagellar basal-body rod protein FlgF
MINASYTAVSAQLSLQRRLDTIAHNVANASTAGFRAELVRFTTQQSPTAEPATAFASTGSTYLSRTAGELFRTGNPLDVAVDGDAWIGVETIAGRAYTRDGRLQISPAGELQTLTGHRVLDPGGSPLQLDPANGAPSIGRDGSISQGGVRAGAIGLFGFDPSARLTRGPDVTVITDAQAVPLVDTPAVGLRQGFQERSNVNPVTEMAKLILDQRLFEAVSTTYNEIEQTRMRALKTLGGSQ